MRHGRGTVCAPWKIGAYPQMKLACILLAAGFSERYGDEDKLLAKIDGVPMLERMLRLYASVPFAQRILVVRPEETAHIALAERYGFTAVHNDHARRGIGSSAAVGAGAVSADVDGALFSVADQPYLTRRTIERLTEAFKAHPNGIVAPSYAGRRGNPVLFSGVFLPAFRALDGDAGGGVILRNNIDKLVTVELEAETELTDIDRKAE